MEDTKKTEQETTEEVETEEETEKDNYTKEEVEALKKEMESNYEKGAQKVIGQKKKIEEALKLVPKIAEDKTLLVKTYDKDPEVAQSILEIVYGGMSIDKFKEEIGYEPDYSDPEYIESLTEKKAQRIIEENKINENFDDFVEQMGLKGDEIDVFKAEFEERRKRSDFKLSNVKTHLVKAYNEVSDTLEKEKEIDRAKVVADIAGQSGQKTGGGKAPKSTKPSSRAEKSAEYSKKLLKGEI